MVGCDFLQYLKKKNPGPSVCASRLFGGPWIPWFEPLICWVYSWMKMFACHMMSEWTKKFFFTIYLKLGGVEKNLNGKKEPRERKQSLVMPRCSDLTWRRQRLTSARVGTEISRKMSGWCDNGYWEDARLKLFREYRKRLEAFLKVNVFRE